MKDKITAHMVVKNEDRFIWYAIKSVLPYVYKFLITDSGSTDNTNKVIQSIRDRKIFFKKKYIKTTSDIAQIRQEQLIETESDWFWIVDGDEIYTRSLSSEIVNIIATVGKNLEGIVVGRFDLLGDIYHYQSETVGNYDLFGKKGHYVIRLINKKNIPALHVAGIYPYEGYYDKNNREIIYHNPGKFKFTKGRLFHAMYLNRSSKGGNLGDTYHRKKYKIELGNNLPTKIRLPEAFFAKKPSIVPNITLKRSKGYEISANLITPIKKIKRLIIS